MAITAADFEYVRTFIRRRAGIVLEDGKEYLVESRLAQVARRESIDTVATLITRLRASTISPLAQKVVEAMTTNETSFFRDAHPFEVLRKLVLPQLIATRPTKTLTMWCGASSTGQEPYTTAMMLHEAIPDLQDWKITFIATDLSSEMIERSRQGRYGQLEVNRGLPAALLVKYFDKQGLDWVVKQPLRQMVDFREMNLTLPWPPLPPCDIVFMRNVLIYFDTETKKQILGKIHRLLRPDGYLFLGGAESTMGLDDSYERVMAEKGGCYRLKSAAAKVAA